MMDDPPDYLQKNITPMKFYWCFVHNSSMEIASIYFFHRATVGYKWVCKLDTIVAQFKEKGFLKMETLLEALKRKTYVILLEVQTC